ncbi:FAD binding domain-containing protein [Aquamicrobium soli]|jgi:carbon-monoxide dehydrogenase medium subunit|uniref:FAD binding domain-containing protein n=1 Tax=Aquamicrobium soli TaxID=1811518 RepID=A0ABV7KHK4_9HYPH
MKPVPFVYHAPRSLDQAVSLLDELEGDVRVTAGGQSLIPMMNLRVVRPDHLVDLRYLDALSGIELTDTHLVVGATTTHRTIEKSPLVRRVAPLLREMASNIAHIPIRERGTIGGSVALADPTAEFPLAALMLDAEMTLSSVRGTRTVKADEFFHSALETELAEDEILTSLAFPLEANRGGSAFTEFSRRKGDFCVAGVAVVVRLRDGRYEAARIGLCGVSDRPVLSTIAGQLAGERADDATTNRIADAIADEIEPMIDGRATVADRRDIARTLVRRTLPVACERAAAIAQGGNR